MGNKPVKPEASPAGAEMSSARHFERSENEDPEPLCPLSELAVDCQALREGVQNLTFAIDEIFEERDDADDTHDDIEARLHGLTRVNQSLVQRLTLQLERHAKQVDAGMEQNERLMATVRLLVNEINRYMAMLVLNIRKLKRLISELDENQAQQYRAPKPRRALYLPQTVGRPPADLVYDVISDQQDVDAMLLQLIRTRTHREELEADMVTVLVFWRDFRYIREQETDNYVIERIEENVIAAADSVSNGLTKLSKNR